MAKNWYPVIDYEKCVGCLTCVEFCPNDVFVVTDGKPDVSNPIACVEFCRGCQKICPAGAIKYSAEVSPNG
ncbi:MAG: 4Fe-4S binding protein [Chloroflexi bacterium]|nr:4Fe-4S binding protein [Chloroflexota bacterium]MBC7331383.1 4Fe-4S binding protein [Synergistota bacterium]